MSEPQSQDDCPPGMIFQKGHFITKGPRQGTYVKARCRNAPHQRQPVIKEPLSDEPRNQDDCPEGQLFRKGSVISKGPHAGTYRRATCYTPGRKKRTSVRTTTRPEVSRRRASPRIPTKEGTLSQFGYNPSDSEEKRFAALDEAAIDQTATTSYDQLNVGAIQNRLEHPQVSRVMKNDKKYLALLKKLWDEYGYFWYLSESEKDSSLAEMYEELGYMEAKNLLHDLRIFRNQNRTAVDAIDDDLTFLVDLDQGNL